MNSVGARIQKILQEFPETIYQTHTWRNEILHHGIRGLDHRGLVDWDDLLGKRVLDIGCATGANCIWAMERGATEVMGIDPDQKHIDTFMKIALVAGSHYPDIFWRQCDLSDGVPDDIKELEFDTVFCFAITQEVGYRKMWSEIPSVKVAYVEGGADSPYTERLLSEAGFMPTLVGFSSLNRSENSVQRPVFRLERNP